jgi:hypothetical protein
MSALKVGDSFPEGVVFSYVPYTPETADITACGIPINYDASKGTCVSRSLPSLPKIFPSLPLPVPSLTLSKSPSYLV